MNIEQNDIRSQKQADSLNVWKTTKRGTICLATGFGKTRVGVLSTNEYINNNQKVLVVTPTTNLRDNEWPNQFNRWVGSVHPNITIECIHSLYNKTKEELSEYSLVIFDEIHMYFGEEFRKIFELTLDCDVLGLTATPPTHNPEAMSYLNKYCPVIYEITLQEAVKLGVLAKFSTYNLPVKFSLSDRSKYKKYNHVYANAMFRIEQWKKRTQQMHSIYDIANEFKDKKEHVMWQPAKEFWQMMTLRKWICYNNPKKIDVILEILQAFPEKKWIIFTKSTKACDEITTAINKLNNPKLLATSYHSKLSNEVRAINLQHYSKSKFNILVAVDALNMGFDLPEIDAGISAAGVSTELTNIQQKGRTLRFKDNKRSLFINLFTDDTQEKKWVENKTKQMNPIWVKSVAEIKKYESTSNDS